MSYDIVLVVECSMAQHAPNEGPDVGRTCSDIRHEGPTIGSHHEGRKSRVRIPDLGRLGLGPF